MEQSLLDKWSLAYFGFMNYPYICPQEIDKIAAVLDVFGIIQSILAIQL